MQGPFAERIYGIPWLALAGVGLVLALVYVFVPGGVDEVGMRWFVLRWFHTVAWVFLASAALVKSKVTATPVEAAAPLAATGGLIYVALMVTTLAG